MERPTKNGRCASMKYYLCGWGYGLGPALDCEFSSVIQDARALTMKELAQAAKEDFEKYGVNVLVAGVLIARCTELHVAEREPGEYVLFCEVPPFLV